MANQKKRMRELVGILNEATRVYEQEDGEIMSNFEYDRLFDELVALEKELDTCISGSPTKNVGYEILSELPKEAHKYPMLSLDKTKEAEGLKEWLSGREGLLSWKLDGLTVVLSYEDGKLVKAVTRGNGQIGEVITNNCKVFNNLPLTISHKGKLVLRGEAVIKYSDFRKINEKIEDIALKYKNPRNLCSGTVRQLNNKITAERKVNFYAFSIVEAETEKAFKLREEELSFLEEQYFEVVDYRKVNEDNILNTVNFFKEEAHKNDLPSDGLVLIYNDIEYGKSLGATSKFPRDAIAFKWEDEVAETTLTEIEWSASRTGLINPVAIFEPVELEGTRVSRASVHNLSILKELQLEVGDKIGVYKANMIIPQISENFSLKSKTLIDDESGMEWIRRIAPKTCPVCFSETVIKDDAVKTLHCPNPECQAKQIKSFMHFVSRDAMNIDGLSEATLEKLVDRGLIKELADIFHIENYKEEIIEMEGFGDKSFENLKQAVETAKNTTVVRFLYSLGIPSIGLANAKNICSACNFDWDKIRRLGYEELIEINGIGDIMAKGFTAFFTDEKKREAVEAVRRKLKFEEVLTPVGNSLEGENFVITGNTLKFENRNVLKAFIEEHGGKVTTSVTSKTNFLINNDSLSNSTKNKAAKKLNVNIITEDELLAKVRE